MKKYFYYIGWIVFSIGIILGIYVGGYLMFVRPIVDCLIAFDLGTLTGSMIGWTIAKCIFAGTASGVVIGIAYIITMILFHISKK